MAGLAPPSKTPLARGNKGDITRDNRRRTTGECSVVVDITSDVGRGEGGSRCGEGEEENNVLCERHGDDGREGGGRGADLEGVDGKVRKD
jgi:hypothetical protein